jgi:hypothetical protein
MANGAFLTTVYQANQSARHYKIKVKADTESLLIGVTANAPVGGIPTEQVSAQVGGSRRGIGMHARHVTLKFTAALPTGFVPGSRVSVPILTAALAGSYLGVPVVVEGLTPEKFR